MAFFRRPSDSVNGPSVNNLKVTFENLCAELQDPRYQSGIDCSSISNTITDLYGWLAGIDSGRQIRLPAPADDPDDVYRGMWPEGSKVRTRSRRDSKTSASTSQKSGRYRVPELNAAYTSSRVSSVRSSVYAPVKTRFVDDQPVDDAFRNISLNEVRARGSTSRRPEIQAPRNATMFEPLRSNNDNEVEQIITSNPQRERKNKKQANRSTAPAAPGIFADD